MPQERRESSEKTTDIGTGPYLAKVIGHLDPSFMGGLEVTLLRSDGNILGDTSQTYAVKYAPPFFGSTAFEYMGNNSADFNDTQKSYGMWFIPPDVGVTVMVVFIDGDSSQGYWLACVPGRFINQMVPAIGATDAVEFAAGDAEYYDVEKLPVGEINRRANDLGENLQTDKVPKPVHPIAEAFRSQGLLEDNVRGATETTSRRNVPSNVFGISTPGPADRGINANRNYVGDSDNPTQTPVPVGRLGGSQFVMDDGDDRYVRSEPASDAGPDYVPAGDGDPTIPKDEYIRLRTRTGHQILLHNSEDLIYIGNSKGTSWIELTSNGKIDIFAEDSISIHTKQDFNFYADRDINMEAGRNVNIKASATIAEGGDSDGAGYPAGRLYLESAHDTRIHVGGDTKLTTTGECHIASLKSNFITSAMDNNFKSIMDTYLQSSLSTHFKSNTGTYMQSMTTIDVNSKTDMKFTAGGSGSFGAADLKFTGGSIDLNGPEAPESGTATGATAATPTVTLNTTPNVIVDPFLADWPQDRYDPGTTLDSIMFRIPMHEPWPSHENLDPTSVDPELTDREQAGGADDGTPSSGEGDDPLAEVIEDEPTDYEGNIT
jgi:hypothetical protein